MRLYVTFVLMFVLTDLFSQTYLDSISGFDQVKIIKELACSSCDAEELKGFIKLKTREYIKTKYNLWQRFAEQPNQVMALGNEDFENQAGSPGPNIGGPVLGWSLFGDIGATPSNFCSLTAVSPTANYTVFNAPIVDPIMLAPSNTVSSYYSASSAAQPAGSCFIRLNNASASAKVVRLSKTYIVSSSSALIRYAYRLVLSNPNHPCCQSPGLNIRATITNTSTGASFVLTCPNLSLTSGASCGPQASGFSVGNTLNGTSSNYNHSWMPGSMDLSSYIGQQVTFDVTVNDCSPSGHAGYVYFDALIGSVSLGANNLSVQTSSNITLSLCGSGTLAITAPFVGNLYSWSSGNISIPPALSVPNVTNTSITVMQTGTLSLSSSQVNSSCWATNYFITINNNTLTPIIVNSVTPSCLSSTAMVTIANPTVLSSNPVWYPTPLSLNTTSINAIYPAGSPGIVSYSNGEGCTSKTLFMAAQTSSPPTITNISITPICTNTSVPLIPNILPNNDNLIILYTSVPNGAFLTPSSVTVSPGLVTPSLGINTSLVQGNYNFMVKDTLSNCVANGSFYIDECVAAGLNKFTNTPISFYPNPVKDDLYIDDNVGNSHELKVYDYLGKVVFTEKVVCPQKIRLTNLINGVYLIKLRNGSNYYSFRFIKE